MEGRTWLAQPECEGPFGESVSLTLAEALDAEHVDRPELVSALSGAPLGACITAQIAARVPAHPEGGC